MKIAVASLATLLALAPTGARADDGASCAASPLPGVSALASSVVGAHDCFPHAIDSTTGAWYHKVESLPSSAYRGLRTTGVLPQVSFDPTRWFVSPNGVDDYQTGPLDRPSVYGGGEANGHQLDAGLTWDRVYDAHGRALWTDSPDGSDGRSPAHQLYRATRGGAPVVLDETGRVVASGAAVGTLMATLKPDHAFRPYWRTTNDHANQWAQPHVGAADNDYFYPGEPFTMTVFAGAPDQVEMDIRADVPGGPFFHASFRAQGFGRGAERFKRVSSIDQFRVVDGKRKGNEDRTVIPTATRAVDAQWTSAFLLDAGMRSAKPLGCRDAVEYRGGDTAGRYDSIFPRTAAGPAGQETISIVPTMR